MRVNACILAKTLAPFLNQSKQLKISFIIIINRKSEYKIYYYLKVILSKHSYKNIPIDLKAFKSRTYLSYHLKSIIEFD